MRSIGLRFATEAHGVGAAFSLQAQLSSTQVCLAKVIAADGAVAVVRRPRNSFVKSSGILGFAAAARA